MVDPASTQAPRFEYQGVRVGQQPDDVSCGPTCLQSLYDFYGLRLTIPDVQRSVRSLDHGGTLGVLLGLDALERGFRATLYSYNLWVFDPTWFAPERRNLAPLLEQRLAAVSEQRLRSAVEAYLEFVLAGGEIRHEELTPGLLSTLVRDGAPPITALSATYLYGCARERYEGDRATYDDVRGDPIGHFVVLTGVDGKTGEFQVSDPSGDVPGQASGTYWVSPHRLMGAILLGATTYDGNLLMIHPRER